MIEQLYLSWKKIIQFAPTKKQPTTTSRHNYNNKCFVIVLMIRIWKNPFDYLLACALPQSCTWFVTDLKFKGLFNGVFLFACMHELLSVWNCLIITSSKLEWMGGEGRNSGNNKQLCQNMDERWRWKELHQNMKWNILLVVHPCNFLISFVQAKLPQCTLFPCKM